MTTSKFRGLLAFGAVLAGFAAYPAFASAAAPNGVQAFYMYGTTTSGLVSVANQNGCVWAKNQPDNETAIMLLDFGAPRRLLDGSYGAIDFSNATFSNADILVALKSASDGYHNCHVRGGAIIEYGNSNYHMSNSGMTTTDAWNAGYDQELTADHLGHYQIAKGYNSQGATGASDIEPSYDNALISKQLVNGASAEGWGAYDNFGSVDGCPTSGSTGACNNGWTVADVAYVSFHGVAVPLPEIYYAVSASQWTVVRKYWDSVNASDYFFDGVTGESPAPSGGIDAVSAWNLLNSKNPGLVGSNLICFGSGC
jgi:hypothetical protein